MPLARETLERQLKQAQEALEARGASLSGQGFEPKQYRRDPKWRQLNAHCNQIRSRLRAVRGVEEINAAVERHKSEKLAAVESGEE